MAGESGEQPPTCRPNSTRCRSSRSVAVEEIAGVHTAVLLPQVLAALNIQASGTYMDATFGRGGHAGAILEKLIANGRLLCLDRDPDGHRGGPSPLRSRSALVDFSRAFSSLAAVARIRFEPGLKFDGILFDLGVSSPQTRRRGARLQLHAGRTSRHAHDAGRGHERRGCGQRRAAAGADPHFS